jgi:hypothetical protein
MDYSQINIFLDKFKNTLFKKENILKEVSNTIFEEIGVDLGIDNIKIKNNEITIKTSPIIKNEILIHKESILNKINKKQQTTNFLDIN